MDKKYLNWELGFMQSADLEPKEWFPSVVPGAVQLDYANAHGWEPWYKNDNVRNYAWMEDVYWLYRASLCFDLQPNQKACLVFGAIDYRYQIRVGDEVLCDGEGMFSEVRCDVTKFSGRDTVVEVLIYPVPKSDDSNSRDQADHSCKAAACYGWDWHPRLVTSGIWDDTYLLIEDEKCIERFDISYRLNDTLDVCDIHIEVDTGVDCSVSIQIVKDDLPVAERSIFTVDRTGAIDIRLTDPDLWYPIGYGKQPIYSVTVSTGSESNTRKLGIRRSKLVMNEGSWAVPGYPKSRAAAPATLEINGIRVFAKGSNWVNASVFPSEMNETHYRSLLQMAKDANMNLMRIWGGGFVNKESFFEICDELGIMVWQEFPLACNEYPDDDDYLKVLEKEAVSIVRRLRTHPCVVMWCGGNELFNFWSGMTDQHHALRLLDRICYSEDRFTPFIMTSPLNGMAHGPYRNYDETINEELITSIRNHHDTAYTEFGAPSMSSKEVILGFMDDEEFNNCNEDSAVWVSHFGFRASWYEAWIRKVEVDHYFNGWSDLDDLIRKTQFLQAMSYRSVFEEARFQWPHCSMVANWCWNEPWPCAANCSVLSWPDVPKPAYKSIQQALRPRAAAVRIDRHLWWAGQLFTGEVWILNDSPELLTEGDITVSYQLDDEWVHWGTLHHSNIPQCTNAQCGSLHIQLPADYEGTIHIKLVCDGREEQDSEYTYFCRCKKIAKKKMLNFD